MGKMQTSAGEEVRMMEKDRFEGNQAWPLVSVIMPAYNAEKYIGEAIVSVLSQTYANWELIILDDCSTDHTAEIAERFVGFDSRIRLLRNLRNMGVARTRNRGLELAEGQWIALLDSDDVWHSDKLEKQLMRAEESGADIVYCSYSLVGENGENLSDYMVPKTTTYDDMLKENVLSCTTVLLRRAMLSYHSFSPACYHEDYAFWLELLKAGYKAAGNREVLADYRIVKGSRSNNKLRSAKNRWQIYRRVEKLPLLKSVNVFAAYAFHGLIKHRRI